MRLLAKILSLSILAASAAHAQQVDTVRLATLAPGALLWLHNIADVKGFYKANGLEVKRLQVADSRARVPSFYLLDVTRAGATAAELGRAATKANGGTRPWLPHFYLGHGIGVNAAEMPMIGTDLGDEFDENFVFEPGMVVVLEPVVWEDGTGGYRSEEIVVITEEGWIPLTDYPYHPYGER